MSQTHDTAIADLAEILLPKQVTSDVIYKALEFICATFSFNGGMIYEIDQSNVFHLKERIFSQSIRLCDTFFNESITPKCRQHLAESSIFYAEAKTDTSEYAQELLKFFSAATLAIISIVDENERIFGLIAFITTESDSNNEHIDFRKLSVMLSLLEKYARVRIYQNRLCFAQASLESILDNTGIDIYVNDFDTHDILYVNKSMAAPYGGQKQFMSDKCWRVLFPAQNGPCEFCPQKQLIDEEGNPTKTYCWDYQRAFDGSWFRVFSSAFRWVDGRLAHVVSSANITDNKRNEALVEYLANYDVLTKLPNRRKLVIDCESRINKALPGKKGYVLFFDIDGFKSINDNFGHEAGDIFLIQLGEFFNAIPLLQNVVYRNGGDEFVALLGSNISHDSVRYLAGFIHERFTRPWLIKDHKVFCNTSIGASCFPDDATTAESLLYKADQAMYYAKKKGGGALCFANEMV